MFDEIILTGNAPGSNVQGDIPDGNWVYLLPTLKLGRVLYVGRPSQGTLRTLHRFAQTVVVAESVSEAEPGFELVYVEGARRRIDWPAVKRVLSEAGLVYLEDRGEGPLTAPEDFTVQTSLWLTPAVGRMQTAVPLSDPETIRYFRDNRLFSHSIDLQTFKSIRRRLKKRPSSTPEPQSDAIVDEPAAPQGSGFAQRLKSMLRKGRNAVIPLSARLETLLTGSRIPGALLRRRGSLLTLSTTPRPGPPRYIQDIARAYGVRLGAYRWGYAARGSYQSQKLLFFMFSPDVDRPDYLVKMVRNAVFNPRLEREYQGLLYLQRGNVMPAGTFPVPAFLGHHRDLAIVGQTVIAGEPFEARSKLTAECPYAAAAVDWIIELGDRTCIDPATNTVDDFVSLTERLVADYAPAAGMQKFLFDLAERLRSHLPPLVFQHGDAGTWNLLVTCDGRVAFLDWENATPRGVPLWDLFYFLRGYCVAAGHRSGDFSDLGAFEHYFLNESSISPLVVRSVQDYCDRLGLPPTLVELLFYFCWVFWAVKQAPMIEPDRRQSAHFWQILKLCVERRDAPTLTRIFSL